MQVNIFHYHLQPGGVTRIIQSQVEGIRSTFPDWKIKVFAGACPEPQKYREMGAELVLLEELNYLPRKEYSFEEVHIRVSELTEHLTEELGREEIIHFHNLTLGKNPVVTLVMHRLAATGHRIFNHVHDLAEDRPSNMEFLNEVIEDAYGAHLPDVMYPDHKNVRFGALNTRDVERIHQHGVKRERIHFLPNPVKMNNIPDISAREAREYIVKALDLDPAKKIMTYPVRVIRRKNIGEYILLAALFSDKAEFLVTLPPQNPVEIAPYQDWKDFCIAEGVPVRFEVGKKVDFDRLLSASDSCITTSSMEGFGMVYMEPWLMRTPVLGRDIEYVTQDLKKAGIEFPLLYNVLKVPGNDNDFKDLHAEGQKRVIREVMMNEGDSKESILEMNAWLGSLFDPVSEQIIRNNIEIIKKEFSLEKYTKRLYEAYHGYTG